MSCAEGFAIAGAAIITLDIGDEITCKTIAIRILRIFEDGYIQLISIFVS